MFSKSTSFQRIFGQHKPATPLNSSQDLTTNRDDTDFFNKLIMLLYLVFSVIIMLNILIAMLNTIYERIQENCDLEWKFLQSQLLKVGI